MNDNWLMQKSQVVEKPLQSKSPILGPIIAKTRNIWGAVAAKWLIHDIVLQQNEYNRIVTQQLQTLDSRVIEQDHEIVILTKQVAELNITIKQMQKELRALHENMAQFEKNE